MIVRKDTKEVTDMFFFYFYTMEQDCITLENLCTSTGIKPVKQKRQRLLQIGHSRRLEWMCYKNPEALTLFQNAVLYLYN